MQHPSNTQNSGPIDVVVIDDEKSILEGCQQTLEAEGYRALVANDGRAGLKVVEEVRPRVVLLDLRMPGISGVEVLERLPGIDPRIVPIVITGYGSIDTAVQAMKLGAFDFLTKPFDPDQLLGVVDRGLRRYGGAEPTSAPAPRATASADVATRAAVTAPDLVLRGLDAVVAYAGLGAEGSLADELRAIQNEAAEHARSLGRLRERSAVLAEVAADLHLVDEIVERHEFRRSSLIQVLLDLQARKNWLPRHVLLWVSRRLNVPLARIYQVAHFYEAFSLKPQGRHTVQVCTGTACHVQGAPELAATISAVLGIKPGETDGRMMFTLKTVNCLGCCALAPVMKVDDTYYSNPSLKELRAIFKRHEEEKGEVKSCQN